MSRRMVKLTNPSSSRYPKVGSVNVDQEQRRHVLLSLEDEYTWNSFDLRLWIEGLWLVMKCSDQMQVLSLNKSMPDRSLGIENLTIFLE